MSRKKRDEQFVEKLVSLGLFVHNTNRLAEILLGISLVQFHLLKKLISLPACSASILAQEMGVHHSTLTHTAKRLIIKKYIHLDVDPKDARKKIFVATRAGMKMYETFMKNIPQLMEKCHLDRPADAKDILLQIWGDK